MTLTTKIKKPKSLTKPAPRYSPKVERALKDIITGMVVLSALRPTAKVRVSR